MVCVFFVPRLSQGQEPGQNIIACDNAISKNAVYDSAVLSWESGVSFDMGTLRNRVRKDSVL